VKTLNINSGQFVIVNGYIKSKTPFKVVEKDNIITIGNKDCKISSISTISDSRTSAVSINYGNTIVGNIINNTMNGSCISINGISIGYDNNILTIDGDVNKIILNGKTIPIDNAFSSKENKEDEYLEYPIENISTINTFNDVFIKINADTSVLSKEFTLNLQGSGYILVEGKTASHKFNSFLVKLQGSGDIVLENIYANLINLNLIGSGDIDITHSESDNVNISLIGSGDINGKHNVFKNINQNKVGSGDISLNE